MTPALLRRPPTDLPLPVHSGAQFATLVDRCLARARRDGKPLAVLALTVDHVGVLGHPAPPLPVVAAQTAQTVLDAVAQRLRWGVRSNDEVAQLGPRDLAVVLLAAGPAECSLVAARLRRVLSGTYPAHGLLLGAELRIGIAHAGPTALTGRELVRMAAQALGGGPAGPGRWGDLGGD